MANRAADGPVRSDRELATAARNHPARPRVSGGVVTHLQQTIARRPALDLAIRALAIALLALLIFVGLPAVASTGG